MKKVFLILVLIVLVYLGIKYLNQFLAERTQAPITEEEQRAPGAAPFAAGMARQEVLRNFGFQVAQNAQRHHIQIIKRDTAFNTRTGMFETTIECEGGDQRPALLLSFRNARWGCV